MTPTFFQRMFLPVIFLLGGILTITAVRGASGSLSSQTLGWAHAWQVAIIAVVAVGILAAIISRVSSRVRWEAILNITVFLGVWFVLILFIRNLELTIVLAAVFTLVHLFFRRTFVHDLFYLIGSVGVAVNFAAWLPSEVLVVGVVVFTVYDMTAGVPGGPIAALASSVVRYGVVPGFVIPAHWRDLGNRVERAIHSDAALLGAGDVILPLALVARAGFSGIWPAVAVLVVAILGACVLANRKDLHPRAALLPLAVGAVLPFLFFIFK
jgi:presenilin-like A22 family membrane protease